MVPIVRAVRVVSRSHRGYTGRTVKFSGRGSERVGCVRGQPQGWLKLPTRDTVLRCTAFIVKKKEVLSIRLCHLACAWYGREEHLSSINLFVV